MSLNQVPPSARYLNAKLPPAGTTTDALRVPLARFFSGWLCGSHELKSPSTETGFGVSANDSVKVSFTPALSFDRLIMGARLRGAGLFESPTDQDLGQVAAVLLGRVEVGGRI